jgi:predicted metal-dependent hydrolase
MTQQSYTPADISIEPRNREYAIADCLGRNWFGGSVFKTAWFNAMSITFPLGEKFFIDSVRHYIDRISDPKLQQEIRGFCGQEGFHRREHQRYNQLLCSQRGYDLDYLEGRIEKSIAITNKVLSARQRLAATAALEHITAILAQWSLSEANPMRTEAEPAMQALWAWHAAEEMEHKAVAFDVYRAIGGDEKMRKTALRRASFFLTLDIVVGAVHMMRRDGQLWRLQNWREGFRFLLGKQGVLRQVWPAYKEYFRDDFHPWQQDTRSALQHWKSIESGAVA